MVDDRSEDVVDVFKPPERYWRSNRSLDNFEPKNKGQLYARNYALSMDGDPKTGMYIYGGTGRGKSHFLVGMARHFRGYDKDISYVCRSSDLWQVLGKYSEFDMESAEKFLTPKILIIDDFAFSDNRQSELRKFHAFIQYAYDENKRLFLSSTYSPYELGKAMRRSKLHSISEQTISRLVEMCEIADFGRGDERVARILKEAKDLKRKNRFLM